MVVFLCIVLCMYCLLVFFFKQKTAYEMRISDWSSDVCSSDLRTPNTLRQYLTPEQFRLYEMIWKRALACQMSPAKFDAVSVDLAVGSDANLDRKRVV